MTDTPSAADALKPCPFDAALWKGEPCHNPAKGWITDSRGNRITRLGNRNAYGKLIEAHNREIEYLKSLTTRAAAPQEVNLSKVKQQAVQWYMQKYDSPGVVGMPSDREVLYDFIEYLHQINLIGKQG